MWSTKFVRAYSWSAKLCEHSYKFGPDFFVLANPSVLVVAYLRLLARQIFDIATLLVHGQVTIIFVVSVCLFVCAEFFWAVFDPISIKLGHMLYVWV